jgi:Domain of unknown function (DUF1816)
MGKEEAPQVLNFLNVYLINPTRRSMSMTLVNRRFLGKLNSDMLVKITTFFTNVLDFWGRAWWIEVVTTQPHCTYYFGPFTDAQEAKVEMPGFIEDLEGEFAQEIQIQVKHCKPEQLTIEHDAEEKIMVAAIG